MNEMVERIAKAIGDEQFGYVDKIDTPNTWGISVQLAITAIATMREATDAQRNNFYKMKKDAAYSDAQACFQDADWERSIDAILMDK